MKIKTLSILLLVLTIFSACSSDDDFSYPYIIYKNSSGQVLNPAQTIQVEYNSTYRINAEIGYHDFSGNQLRYEWRIDNGNFKQYSAFDGLNITTLGRYNNLSTVKATLDITFTDEIQPGSTVIIRIRDTDSLAKELKFSVD